MITYLYSQLTFLMSTRNQLILLVNFDNYYLPACRPSACSSTIQKCTSTTDLPAFQKHISQFPGASYDICIMLSQSKPVPECFRRARLGPYISRSTGQSCRLRWNENSRVVGVQDVTSQIKQVDGSVRVIQIEQEQIISRRESVCISGDPIDYDLYITKGITISIFQTMKPIEIRLVGRFRFHSKLASPHQHLLYHGVHSQTDEPLFMKGEEYKARAEQHLLTILQEGGIGIPHMHWCGQEEDYNFIVLEELGDNIESLKEKCGGKLSLKSAFMLGQEITNILQYFHFKSFIHNQIHPRNLMFGQGANCLRLHLVDYSAASRYKDSTTSEHIPPQSQNKKGTPRFINMQFSSRGYMRGEPPSRRDDMQSLLYLVLWLVKGELPWSDIVRKQRRGDGEKHRIILKMKEQLNADKFFESCHDLIPLYRYMNGMTFEEKPRYTYFKSVFTQRIQAMGLISDKIYDWMLLEEPQLMPQPQLKFQIIPGEDEFIKGLAEEMKAKQKGQSEGKVNKTSERSGRQKNSKQCAIY